MKVLIFGTGGHSKVVVDALMSETPASQPVFADQNTDWSSLGIDCGVIAVGDNATRRRIAEEIRRAHPQFRFLTVVHPRATVSPQARIGEGSVVFAGVVVNPGARVSAHVILNSSCVIEHETMIGDFASIGPGALLGGNVTIGQQTAVGLGACVRHGLQVGEFSVVGMGSVVTKDLPSLVTAYGNPCQIQKARQPSDPYL